jgi:hypothetical protein
MQRLDTGLRLSRELLELVDVAERPVLRIELRPTVFRERRMARPSKPSNKVFDDRAVLA